MSVVGMLLLGRPASRCSLHRVRLAFESEDMAGSVSIGGTLALRGGSNLVGRV
jgi:hypothetical protein